MKREVAAIINEDIMNFSCENCDRGFRCRAGLNRHLKRKTPCRRPMFNCVDCDKLFVSQQSLKKHKILYCKRDAGNKTPLSDILAKLIERDMTLNGRPVDEFLDIITSDPVIDGDVTNHVVDNEKPMVEQVIEPVAPGYNGLGCDNSNVNGSSSLPNSGSTIPNYFNEIVNSWISQLFMLEGKFLTNLSSHSEAFQIIDRMLQDGLITPFDHSELYYTTGLFIRLHKIHELGLVKRFHNEYIEILITLFEMKKLSREVFKLLLLNV